MGKLDARKSLNFFFVKTVDRVISGKRKVQAFAELFNPFNIFPELANNSSWLLVLF